MADEAYRKLLKCYHDVEDRVQSRPEIGIVLGSGLVRHKINNCYK